MPAPLVHIERRLQRACAISAQAVSALGPLSPPHAATIRHTKSVRMAAPTSKPRAPTSARCFAHFGHSTATTFYLTSKNVAVSPCYTMYTLCLDSRIHCDYKYTRDQGR